MEMRPLEIVVLSDIHLGTYACKARELTNYLKSISPGVLILNGDIIDGWQFSKRFFPKTHRMVIHEIFQLMNRGTRVFYITGNHDEALRRYADLQTGNFSLTDKIVLKIDDKMTWIFHGDVFDHTNRGAAKILSKLGSKAYGLLTLLNRLINSIIRLAGGKKVYLSKKIVAAMNRISKIDAFEQVAAELAVEQGYDYVICGHIHQPQNRVIETKKGRVTYLNAGDWVEHMTALEYSQGKWSVYTYDASCFAQKVKPEPGPAVSVLTNDIHFHFNSLAI